MLADRVKCDVPAPAGPVGVGSTITLGAKRQNFSSFLEAFGGGNPAYFVLSDGAGRTVTGVWTVNAAVPETATITEIIWNDRTRDTSGETFSGALVAWNEAPAREIPLPRDSPMGGLRNLVVNGNFALNSRGYVSSTATTAAGQETLDGWAVVTSGQSLSWTDAVGVRTVTAPAGGVERVIPGADNLGGLHTLSWTGTATATVNGATVTNGGQVTLTGGADVTLRLTGGTASRVQLEPGPKRTPFERRHRRLERVLAGAPTIPTIGASATLTADQAGLVRVSAASGSITLTLPSAGGGFPLRYDLVRTDTSTNTATLAGAGSDTIEGASTLSLLPGVRYSLISDGVSAWYLLSNAVPAQGTSWERTASGLLIQRGAPTTVGGAVTVTFPRAYASTDISLALAAAALGAAIPTYQGLTASGFFLQTWDAAGVAVAASCSYVAIGR